MLGYSPLADSSGRILSTLRTYSFFPADSSSRRWNSGARSCFQRVEKLQRFPKNIERLDSYWVHDRLCALAHARLCTGAPDVVGQPGLPPRASETSSGSRRSRTHSLDAACSLAARDGNSLWFAARVGNDESTRAFALGGRV